VYSASTIGGDIQVVNSGFLVVNSANIDGNLQAFDNTNSQFYFGNTIGGDLQAFDNLESVTIWNNVIDGNLQCKENIVEPTGGDNQVSGNMEDQCANLQSADWNYQIFLPISGR
jgi:hypothetical protein